VHDAENAVKVVSEDPRGEVHSDIEGVVSVVHVYIIPKGRGFVKGKTSFSDRDSKPYERSCVGVARFHVCIIPSLVGFVKGRASVF
jgi:hypothetical protein